MENQGQDGLHEKKAIRASEVAGNCNKTMIRYTQINNALFRDTGGGPS